MRKVLLIAPKQSSNDAKRPISEGRETGVTVTLGVKNAGMGRFSGKRIALGVGGGIAAYKAAEVARALMKEDATEVRVAMTEAATHFVSALTFQALTRKPVLTDLLDAAQDATYGHLDVARGADLFLIVPATADLIGRIRAGLGNDGLTAALLAARCPVLLAPAMNVAMWENAIVQENLAALTRLPGFHVVAPTAGELACGDVGPGRLAEPPAILDAAAKLLGPRDLAGRRLLVTAGPTREPIDPVRFVSNRSSGKMGYAVAAAALRRGATVTLVSGPVSVAPPPGAVLVPVTTAEEMLRASLAALPGIHAVIAAAAVADYRPAEVAAQKIKKGEGAESLRLERTPDVLAELSRMASTPRPLFVGFAAETEDLLAHAQSKLERKNLDLVIANDVSAPQQGFEVDTNAATLLFRDGKREELALQSKSAMAEAILDRVAALLAAR
jgi:phosphopantothenoylcysteine decarboxylase/phosphopantothenate--cysteine ligase